MYNTSVYKVRFFFFFIHYLSLSLSILVQNEADPKSHSYVENGVSPDMDYRDPPSSLELSPSDSSGGTYMWDEEGMEPIGNVHRCESYESSEMNSLVCFRICPRVIPLFQYCFPIYSAIYCPGSLVFWCVRL